MIEEGPFPGEDPFHVPAQGLHQDGDDGHKQHVLQYAVEIHQPYSYARPHVEVKAALQVFQCEELHRHQWRQGFHDLRRLQADADDLSGGANDGDALSHRLRLHRPQPL